MVGTSILLCSDFLKDGTCPMGQACPSLHALGLTSSKWDTIAPEGRKPDGVWTHSAGWVLPAYDMSSTSLVEIPSHRVYATAGSTNYVAQYNSFGPGGRYRYRLCANYARGSCTNGGACTNIHVMGDVMGLTRAEVHVNNGSAAATYATHDGGEVLRVCDPNARTVWQEIPSEQILRTKGSELYMQDPTRSQRLMHCAHFYLRKLCNRGPACAFVHAVLAPPLERPKTATPPSRSNSNSGVLTPPLITPPLDHSLTTPPTVTPPADPIGPPSSNSSAVSSPLGDGVAKEGTSFYGLFLDPKWNMFGSWQPTVS